jgi:hypothetical protein
MRIGCGFRETLLKEKIAVCLKGVKIPHKNIVVRGIPFVHDPGDKFTIALCLFLTGLGPNLRGSRPNNELRLGKLLKSVPQRPILSFEGGERLEARGDTFRGSIRLDIADGKAMFEHNDLVIPGQQFQSRLLQKRNGTCIPNPDIVIIERIIAPSVREGFRKDELLNPVI